MQRVGAQSKINCEKMIVFSFALKKKFLSKSTTTTVSLINKALLVLPVFSSASSDFFFVL
jgi:hypothetical protein